MKSAVIGLGYVGLPVDVKARFDGEYVQRMSFSFDAICFFGTIISVLKKDVVVEGVTGYIVEVKNSNDLINSIETFIKLPYKRIREMSLVGKAKVDREFNRQIVVEAYMNETEKAMK